MQIKQIHTPHTLPGSEFYAFINKNIFRNIKFLTFNKLKSTKMPTIGDCLNKFCYSHRCVRIFNDME